MSEVQPPKAPPRPGSKELRALQKRFKQGYRFDRSSGGHWRVVDSHGDFIEHEGRNITTSDQPSPGSLRALTETLTAAGVLTGTRQRTTARGTRARSEGLKKMSAERDQRRQEEAKLLRERLMKALPETVIAQPQLAADLGFVGAIIAREQGKQLTPDLITSSARRVLSTAWTEVRYQEVFNGICERLELAPDTAGEWYVLLREAKGLDVDRVHVRTPEKGEWPFEVKLLPLETLTVDESYQRPVGWPFVRREAARFDPSLVGTIDVAQRSPSRFAILDGQQRTEIVRLIGVSSIWASVYVGLDHASEARFFLHKNRDRKTVHPFHLYKARLIAEDGHVVAIQAIMDEVGYVPAIGAPKIDRPDNISAIAALEIAYNRTVSNNGRNTLEPTLQILRRSAYGRPMGSSGLLIRGVSRLLSEQEIDTENIEKLVMEIGPELLVARARDAARHNGGSAETSMVRILANESRRIERRRK